MSITVFAKKYLEGGGNLPQTQLPTWSERDYPSLGSSKSSMVEPVSTKG